MSTPMLIGTYLAFIILANFSVAFFGPQFAILNSLVLIGPVLSIRDSLHDRWHGRNLTLRMGLLIASGSAISGLLSIQVLPIAIASFITLVLSGSSDAISYTLLGDRARLVRMNGSNLISSAVDSVFFPLLAFGLPMLWPIVIGQFLAKVAGGFVWSIILSRRNVALAVT